MKKEDIVWNREYGRKIGKKDTLDELEKWVDSEPSVLYRGVWFINEKKFKKKISSMRQQQKVTQHEHKLM